MKREPHPCDDLPVGTWVWWCHHGLILEQLTEPGRNRVDYIYSNKPESEQAVRLAAFRPVKDQAWAATASKVYDEACATARKVYAEARATASKVYDEACATARKVYAEARAPAWKVYAEARAPARKAMSSKLDSEYPGVPYSRETVALIFGE